IFQSAAKQVLSDLVEHSPKILSGVLVAACFEQLLWTDGRLLRVFITETQCGRCERSQFSVGQTSRPEHFDACGDGRNLVEDAEAGFDELLWREAGVTNRNFL